MGLSKSKQQSLRVLVIGAPQSGKTHFLDMFYFGGDSTKVPTCGYNETLVKHRASGRDVQLIEYGSRTKWSAVLRATRHEFDAIYLIVNSRACDEEIMESNNALLYMCELIPNAVVAVVWNILPDTAPINRALQWMPREKASCVCYVDFAKIEWRERVSELFEWTIANSRFARK